MVNGLLWHGMKQGAIDSIEPTADGVMSQRQLTPYTVGIWLTQRSIQHPLGDRSHKFPSTGSGLVANRSVGIGG
ncbi:MAG: hypothetical protein EA001_09490 [Oscillatoriales cyanobacterium]|nr:MAG: hypothetical protein EA001_09490 [Oscillatoriales cyanobacterium]